MQCGLDHGALCLHCKRRRSHSARGLCHECFGVRKTRNLYPLPERAPPPPKATVCRHCGVKPISRPRGLCWPCYYTPGVLALFPITSKYARRGSGQGHRMNAPHAATPTHAEPGSDEKIRVLAERAARGEQLFHPEDVGTHGGVVPWSVPLVSWHGPQDTGLQSTHKRRRANRIKGAA